MQLALNDPVFVEKKYNWIERQFLKLIRDKRDLPFIWFSLRILLVIIPISVFLFFNFSWWLAVPLLAFNMATGLGPFILMLHNVVHRKLFKQNYDWMNNIIPWVLGPFYGETPETYLGHHIMHHAENNQIDDLSCTMNYQRDSIVDFLKYFFLFFLLVIVDLGYYFKRKNRWKFVRRVLMGEVGFLVMCIVLWQLNWQATLMVFLIPLLISRFGAMAGNWSQHGFIDANDPTNKYKNTITCINCRHNRTCWNDGYHAGHHLRPNLHWTELPGELQKNIEKYKQNGAIIFENTDFFVIWFMLMTRNYKYLAKKFVDIGGRFKDEDEIIVFIKQRVARIDVRRQSPNVNVIFNNIR